MKCQVDDSTFYFYCFGLFFAHIRFNRIRITIQGDRQSAGNTCMFTFLQAKNNITAVILCKFHPIKNHIWSINLKKRSAACSLYHHRRNIEFVPFPNNITVKKWLIPEIKGICKMMDSHICGHIRNLGRTQQRQRNRPFLCPNTIFAVIQNRNSTIFLA